MAGGARRGLPAPADFERLNEEQGDRRQAALRQPAQRRPPGSLRQKDPRGHGLTPLSVYFHGLIRIDGARAGAATPRRCAMLRERRPAQHPEAKPLRRARRCARLRGGHGGAAARARARDRRRGDQGRPLADANELGATSQVPALGHRLQVPPPKNRPPSCATSRSPSAAPAPSRRSPSWSRCASAA